MKKASIIIRTFNEELHLGNLLDSLKDQSHQDFEVVIVDSGSTDSTLDIARKHPTKIIEIESKDFTFGYSLNVGIEEATGDYMVLVSAHVLPQSKDWLKNLLAPFADDNVAMVYGRQIGCSTTKFSEERDFKRLFGKTKENYNAPKNYANNANSAIRKSMWKDYNFDEYLFGLEDIDWSRHVVGKGYDVMYVPDATIHHIHNEKWHQVYNRYRREAIAAVRIGLDEPPQAGLSMWFPIKHIFLDLLTTFPNYTKDRIEEILRFRYYQAKASRVGMKQGKDINFESEKEDLFYPRDNQAVVIKGKNNAKLEHFPLPDVKPGDVLVKVLYVGVCKTDIEVLEGTLGYYKDGIASYPIVPGHEWVAEIVKIGSNNRLQERLNVGDRVVGECILSRDPATRTEVGVINHNGAYSEYVVMPGAYLQEVPDKLESKSAVFAEPMAVCLRAIRRIEHRLEGEKKIAVIGAGQIGNLSAQVLSKKGHRVTVFDTRKDRLSFVKNSVHETSTKLHDLENFDVIVEATGSPVVLEEVMAKSTVDSTILLLGFPYGPMQYNFEDIVGNEKVIVGSVGAEREDFVKALSILQDYDMKPFTDNVLPLSKYKDAWENLREGKKFKILLQP